MNFTKLYEIKFYGQIGKPIDSPNSSTWVYEVHVEEFYLNRSNHSISTAKYTLIFEKYFDLRSTPNYDTGDWIIIYGHPYHRDVIKNDGDYLMVVSINAWQVISVDLANKLKKQQFRKIKRRVFWY